MIYKVFTDGGSRGNPGKAACAFVVYDDAGNLREKRGNYLGIATNNEAEYNGVIRALDYLQTVKDIEEVNFFLDSQLVVNQLNGFWKVKEPRMRDLLLKIRERESGIARNISFSYVPREQNTVADALLNETLDAQ